MADEEERTILVPRENIQTYAKRNTSPKMPVEEKFVNAYIDSLLNSTKLQETYFQILERIQFGGSFLGYLSFWKDAVKLNKEPFISIVAYSMLKKDMILFEMISSSLFTGTVEQYIGTQIYSRIFKTTDEPGAFTDLNSFTDAESGNITIAFKNIYTVDYDEQKMFPPYQTKEKYESNLKDFLPLITMTKPARVAISVYNDLFCSIICQGTPSSTEFYNIKNVSSPFTDSEQINYIRSLKKGALEGIYQRIIITSSGSQVKIMPIYKGSDSNAIPDCRYEDGYAIFVYDIRTKEENGIIWGDSVCFESSNENVSNIQFSIDSSYIMEESYTWPDQRYYFLKFELKFPIDPQS